jgi:hypothetical protein
MVSTRRSAKQFARGYPAYLDRLDPRIREHRVERGRELPGPIPDKEPEPRDIFAEIHHEVAALLARRSRTAAAGTVPVRHPNTCP